MHGAQTIARTSLSPSYFSRVVPDARFTHISGGGRSVLSSVFKFTRSSVWAAKVRHGSLKGWLQQQFPSDSDSDPSSPVVLSIFMIHVGIFLLWQVAYAVNEKSHSPGLLAFMRSNFAVSVENLQANRLWTALTACFSHENGEHLFMNSIATFWILPPVITLLGSGRFLNLYLVGGVIASLASAKRHEYLDRRRTLSLGASGANYAALAYLICRRPSATLQLFFVVPVRAWMAGVAILLYDASNLYNQGSTVDSAGHLGGAFAGIAYFLLCRIGIRFI